MARKVLGFRQKGRIPQNRSTNLRSILSWALGRGRLPNNSILRCPVCRHRCNVPVAKYCGCILCNDPACMDTPCPPHKGCYYRNTAALRRVRNLEYDSARIETLSTYHLHAIQCHLMPVDSNYVTAMVDHANVGLLIEAMNDWGDIQEEGDIQEDENENFTVDYMWSWNCRFDHGRRPDDDDTNPGMGMVIC